MTSAPKILRDLGGFFFFTMATASVLQAADPWSVWDHLNLLVGRRIAVAQRDGACFAGSVKAVTSTSFVINPDWNQMVKGELAGPATRFEVHRADVMRISEGWVPPGMPDLVYSARSSWSDVQQLRLVGREEVSVQTLSGQELRGKASVTVDSIQLGSRVLDKSDIRSVDYLRFKPLTSKQQGLIEDDASLLDPRLWFNQWFVPLVRIRVYDKSATEDNSAICATR